MEVVEEEKKTSDWKDVDFVTATFGEVGYLDLCLLFEIRIIYFYF